MERIAASKIMATSLMGMMIMALLAARVQAADELDIGGEHRTWPCAKLCAKKCVFKFFPPRIALCFGLCMLKCKIRPSEGVFNCTSDCASSMVNSYNTTVMDAEKVGSFVDSCYEFCNQ